MRIVHVTGYFVINMAYQENLLPVGQFELGHDVFILTGRNEPDFGFNRETRRHPKTHFNYRGVNVIRLDDYFEITNKGPILRGLLLQLYKLQPDILFIHDVGTSFLAGLLYKLLNPQVRLQVDCHSTPANARNSKIGPLYHGIFKILFQLFSSKFDRIFAISPETIDFMHRFYGLCESQITLLPLPGDPSLLFQREEIRARIRQELNIHDEMKIIIHTGKLPGDKETETVLKAFSITKDANIRLLIAGSIEDGFKPIFDKYLENDSRIVYVGWVNAGRLRELFLSSDLLVQPGSLSNTFIDAICCGLPILLDDTPQGRYLTSFGNGSVISRGDVIQLADAVKNCLLHSRHPTLKKNSELASDHFGYLHNAKITLDHLS